MKRLLRFLVFLIFIGGILHLLYHLYANANTTATPRNPTLIRHEDTHDRRGTSEEVELRVIVMTYKRAESLVRCLASLNEAEYYGDRVHIDIWIDRSKKDNSINDETFKAASQFRFKHGTVKVNKHANHVGLYGQWLNTWRPRENTKEIAIFVEDDLTLSKYFYKWLKLVHKKYDSVPRVNGFACQGKSIKHAGDKGRLHGPETEVVFSYPIIGSWGFSPSPKNWVHFLNWYDEASLNKSFVPAIPGILPTVWYKQAVEAGKADTIWTMWHIYHAYKNHELTIYVNLPNGQGLSVNWEEPGLHYFGHRKTITDPLLQTWEEKFEKLPDVPVELDAHGKIIES